MRSFLSICFLFIVAPIYPEDQVFILEELDSIPLPYIRGIVLIDDKEKLLSRDELKNISGLDTSEVTLPGPEKNLSEKLSPFLCLDPEGESCEYLWDAKTLTEIKKKIYSYYREESHPFIRIYIPDQDSHSNVLQIIVEESTLGEVKVSGNHWIPESRFKNYLKLEPGQPISQKELNKDVNFMNRNPYRQVDVIYSPGSERNTTDLTLQVQDRIPFRFYVGADNRGVASTGRQRVFAGFTWDQIFRIDQAIFYQYTTGYQIGKFHAHTVQYTLFLPIQHIIDLYGGYSLVKADIPAPVGNNTGTNGQGSFRYHIPFLSHSEFSQEAIFGFDVKNTNNTMEFVEFFATFGKTVNITQFALAYKAKYNYEKNLLNGALEVLFSPADWFPNQSRANFESLRPHADNKWVYVRAFASLNHNLPHGFSAYYFLIAQGTPQILLPSEQLGIGGYGTVRGYDERQYNADCGVIANIELYTPSFPLFTSRRSHRDRLTFLAFLDGGWGVDLNEVAGSKKDNFLIGIGPGARYSFGNYLSARIDWGIKLHKQADFTGGASMLHFSCTGSY